MTDAQGLPGRPELLHREVTAEEDGRRLDQVLSAWLAEPRSRTAARITDGEVAVGDRLAVKSRPVRAGDIVTVVVPPDVEPFRPSDFPELPVRHEDEHLLVVAKPAGLVVHPGAGRRDEHRATLVDVLRARGVPLSEASGDPDRPGIVHRLDRGTSGVLVIAKTDEAHQGLSDLFRVHDIEREYWTLVDGLPDPPNASVDAPIARAGAQRVRFTVDPDGREAVTHYDVVEALGRASVLRVRLETGRTHQVRVHMSAIGHPVSGDTLYGASSIITRELGLERFALHARRLAFTHPVTGERIEVEEPLPADLEAALERLRQVNSAT